MRTTLTAPTRISFLIGTTVITIGLYLASLHSYLLFHSLVEAFCVFVTFQLFILTWNTRRIQDNNFLIFIGIASFFFGILEVTHALAYKGLGVLPGQAPGLAVQLWIAVRVVFGLSFFAAPFFIERKIHCAVLGIIYGAATTLLLALIFLKRFPLCYIDGSGLTTFKIGAEYLIAAVLLSAVALLVKKRHAFDRRVLRQLIYALLWAVAAEITLTLYKDLYDTTNLIGHLFHLYSYIFIYRSLVVTSLIEPTNVLYRNLKESEARQRAIFDHSPAVIYVKDLEGRYLVLNRTARDSVRHLTAQVDDILGKTPEELFPKEIADNFRGGDEEIIRTGAAIQGEDRVAGPDGGRIYLEHKFPLRDESGRIYAVAGIATDITKRKRAEQELARSEYEFRSVFETSAAGMAQVNAVGRFIRVNEKFCDITGYGQDELLSMTFSQITHPEDREKTIAIYAEALRGEHRQWSEEKRYLRKDGTAVWVKITGSVLLDADGGHLRSTAVVEDITELKKAAREVQEARDEAVRERLRLEAILQTIPSGLIVFDAASATIILQNRMARSMFQHALNAKDQKLRMGQLQMTKPDGSLFRSEDLPGSRAIQTGELVSDVEMMMITPDGREVTILNNAAPLRDESGAVTGAVIAFNDITARKKAEEALQRMNECLENRVVERTIELTTAMNTLQDEFTVRRQAEQALGEQSKMLEAFFRGSMTCLAILDREFDFVRVNAAYAFQARQEPDYFIGRNHFELYPSDEVKGKFEEVVRTGKPWVVFERPFVYPNQPERGVTYWDLFAEPLFDERGEVEYIVFSLIEVTERKRAEKQLAESQTRLLETLECMNNGFFTLDKEWRITYANTEATKIWRIDREELQDRSLWEVAPGAVGTIFYDEYHRAVKDKVMVSFEALSPLVDVWVEVRAYPTADGLAVYFHDISERKRAEEALQNYREHLEELVHERTAQLETSNRELESFAYAVSHDLRAPLRSIDGFSSILAEEYAGVLDETAVDYLARIRKGALRMSQLIDALLGLSRITGRDMAKTRVDLTAIARSIAEELEKSDPHRRVDFSLAGDLKAQGDPALLRIVLDNLLRNAWKFSGTRGQARIEFGSTRKERKNIYFVRDNGAGFDMTHASKLFTVFQRLHSAEEFPGIGIGLATVQRIIARHGGRIWAEGAVNAGATFYFTLN